MEKIMATVSQIQKKVQSILSTELGSVKVDADGDIRIDYESTSVRISVEQYGDNAEETVVEITGVLSFETPASAKLYKWMNEKNATIKFGTIYHLDGSKGGTLVLLQYSILGDFLDPEELLNAVRVVVIVANKLDDEVINEFGGKRVADL
jgi:hypothetical protein